MQRVLTLIKLVLFACIFNHETVRYFVSSFKHCRRRRHQLRGLNRHLDCILFYFYIFVLFCFLLLYIYVVYVFYVALYCN